MPTNTRDIMVEVLVPPPVMVEVLVPSPVMVEISLAGAQGTPGPPGTNGINGTPGSDGAPGELIEPDLPNFKLIFENGLI